MVNDEDRKAVQAYYVENGFVASQRNLEKHFATHREAAFKAGQEAERARIIASWCEAFNEVPYDNGCHAHTDQGEGV
jgi:hypothetical protein